MNKKPFFCSMHPCAESKTVIDESSNNNVEFSTESVRKGMAYIYDIMWTDLLNEIFKGVYINIDFFKSRFELFCLYNLESDITYKFNFKHIQIREPFQKLDV
jgi:hypothetical protein